MNKMLEHIKKISQSADFLDEMNRQVALLVQQEKIMVDQFDRFHQLIGIDQKSFDEFINKIILKGKSFWKDFLLDYAAIYGNSINDESYEINGYKIIKHHGLDIKIEKTKYSFFAIYELIDYLQENKSIDDNVKSLILAKINDLKIMRFNKNRYEY